MQARPKLNPGQKGTKTLLDRYCERSIPVRHRYNGRRCNWLTTVEIIVEESRWSPSEWNLANLFTNFIPR